MTKTVGSGSISQKHGSEDPDPDPPQNVMDPEHCSLQLLLSLFFCVLTAFLMPVCQHFISPFPNWFIPLAPFYPSRLPPAVQYSMFHIIFIRRPYYTPQSEMTVKILHVTFTFIISFHLQVHLNTCTYFDFKVHLCIVFRLSESWRKHAKNWRPQDQLSNESKSWRPLQLTSLHRLDSFGLILTCWRPQDQLSSESRV